MKTDILIIGAGISGTAIASALSAYDISLCVLEKTNDISSGASKANSGIVHAGYDARPGTLMAKFNVAGNALYPEMCERLDVPFRQCGSYVLAFCDEEVRELEKLKARGDANGVPELAIHTAEAVLANEAHVSPGVVAGLYAPTAGIVSPYELCIALMEHAMDNGAALFLETPVTAIERRKDRYLVRTPGRSFDAACVINCAGVHADEVHNMLLAPAFEIRPRRGEYFILDKYANGIAGRVIFQCPSKSGKGVLVSPTVHHNIIVGPNAEDIRERDATETTAEGLEEVWNSALKSIPELPRNQIITTFSGVRAEPSGDDFIIQDYPEAPGFIDVAGIKSPGLTAAPAFALFVEEMVRTFFGGLKKRKDYRAERRRMIRFQELSHRERAEQVKRDPLYGRIICRCEGVTEGEIVDLIHRNAGARTLDGVKRRARCGGGRCQGGFCAPRIIDILARELNLPKEEVCKDSSASRILTGETKGKDSAQ
ncbi:MAG: NAD(P)/FAD-dependent oxidoreductase [Candidatus Marinimicrobia bacterium]|nr:NAD(P)/FAD-dependent oxidoreductase [Candidatus Neomarinimicrobiota bacterium]